MANKQVRVCNELTNDIFGNIEQIGVNIEMFKVENSYKLKNEHIVQLRFDLKVKDTTLQYTISTIDTAKMLIEADAIDIEDKRLLNIAYVVYFIDNDFYIRANNKLVKVKINENYENIKITKQSLCWFKVDTLSDYLWFYDYNFDLVEWIDDMYPEVTYKRGKELENEFSDYLTKLKKLFKNKNESELRELLNKLQKLGWQ